MRDFDVSRLPRGEEGLRELIAATAGVDDSEVERHYLEVKSQVDPTSKEGLGKIAKFIIGAANRMPDVAASAFEGHAILLLGVGSAGVCGVPRFEVSDLKDGLLPYLSASPPQWHFFRIAVDGHDVLAVIVEPPQWGDPPFHCHREGAGVSNGATYVRADGRTRQATGAEMSLLFERSHRGASRTAAADLDIGLVGTVRAYECPYQVLEDYIAAIRAERGEAEASAALLPPTPPEGALSARERLQFAVASAAFGQTSKVFGTRRHPTHFLAELDLWEAKMRAAWPTVVETIASGQPGHAFRITNHGSAFLEDVEFTALIRGPVRALEWSEEPPFEKLIPNLPVKWGDSGGISSDFLATLSMPRMSAKTVAAPAALTFENVAEGVRMSVHVGSLRPEGGTFSSDREELVLVLASPSSDPLSCTWSVTARGHHERIRGEFDIAPGGVLDLNAAARATIFS